MSGPRNKARQVALAVLALLLFSPPLIGLFDIASSNGLSWLPIYLFGAWAGVIGLAAWLQERLVDTPQDSPASREHPDEK